MSSIFLRKKLPSFPNYTLVKEDDLHMLVNSKFRKVRVGLYTSSSPSSASASTPRPMLIIVRSTRDIVRIIAPLRAVPHRSEVEFRVIRDALPDKRAPGICVVLKADSSAVGDSWLHEINRLCNTEPTSDRRKLPKRSIGVLHDGTWGWLPNIPLARTRDIESALNSLVYISQRAVPTEWMLCYSQQAPGLPPPEEMQLKDLGPASLRLFAQETVYLVHKKVADGPKSDSFGEWIETLHHPSALTLIKKWPSLPLTELPVALTAIESVVARLRGDDIKRVIMDYGASERSPLVAPNKFRFLDLNTRISLPCTRSPHSEIIQVSNSTLKPTLVVVVPPHIKGAAIEAIPAVFRLNPKSSRLVRLTFRPVPSTTLDSQTFFVLFFCTAMVAQKESKKSASYTQIDGPPVPMPLALCHSLPSADNPDMTSPEGIEPVRIETIDQLGTDIIDVGEGELRGLNTVHQLIVSTDTFYRKIVSISREQLRKDTEHTKGLYHPAVLIPRVIICEETEDKSKDDEIVEAQLLFQPLGCHTDVLDSVLEKEPRLDQLDIRLKLALDVSIALDTVHAFGLVHGAVRPENVLITAFGVPSTTLDNTMMYNCYLVGSWLNVLLPNNTKEQDKLKSHYFVAPELISGGEPTQPGDVYAFGMILYMLVSRTLPFSGNKATFGDVYAMHRLILSGVRPPMDIPEITSQTSLPSVVTELITSCWAEKPEERPSMHAVVNKMFLAYSVMTDKSTPPLDRLPRYSNIENTFGTTLSFLDLQTVRSERAEDTDITNPERHHSDNDDDGDDDDDDNDDENDAEGSEGDENDEETEDSHDEGYDDGGYDGVPDIPPPQIPYDEVPVSPSQIEPQQVINNSVPPPVDTTPVSPDGGDIPPPLISPPSIPMSPRTLLKELSPTIVFEFQTGKKEFKMRFSREMVTLEHVISSVKRVLKLKDGDIELFTEDKTVLDAEKMDEIVFSPETTFRLDIGDKTDMIEVELCAILSNGLSRSTMLGKFINTSSIEDVLKAVVAKEEGSIQGVENIKDLICLDSKLFEMSLDEMKSTHLMNLPMFDDCVSINCSEKRYMVEVHVAEKKEEAPRQDTLTAHVSMTLRTILSVCAKNWGLDEDKCSINFPHERGPVLLEDTLLQHVSQYLDVSLELQFFEPVSLTFMQNDPESKPVQVLIRGNLTLEEVLRQAVAGIFAGDEKEDSTSYVLVNPSTKLPCHSPEINPETDGNTFIVAKSVDLKKIGIQIDGQTEPTFIEFLPQAKDMDVESVLKLVPEGSFEAGTRLILFDSNGVGIPESSRVELDSTYIVCDSEHPKTPVHDVKVDIEGDTEGNVAEFKVLDFTLVKCICDHAAQMLGITGERPVIQDEYGCMIDESCDIVQAETDHFTLMVEK